MEKGTEINITYKVEVLDYQELLTYLINYSNLHTVDKETFAKKITEYGIIITARDSNNKICGISCSYYNRIQRDFGFLSYINVNIDKRGLHIGKKLLKETILLGENLGYKQLKLQVNNKNVAALNLYKGCGFKEETKDTNSSILFKELSII